MSYSHGIFSEREAERRALRDKMRDAFFAEYQAPRLTDPLAINSDPGTQHAKCLQLIGLARGSHAGDTCALDQMEAAFRGFDFGLHCASIPGVSGLSLESVLPESLQSRHFDMSWSRWFDE